jgi:hypothetical protein
MMATSIKLTVKNPITNLVIFNMVGLKKSKNLKIRDLSDLLRMNFTMKTGLTKVLK